MRQQSSYAACPHLPAVVDHLMRLGGHAFEAIDVYAGYERARASASARTRWRQRAATRAPDTAAIVAPGIAAREDGQGSLSSAHSAW